MIRKKLIWAGLAVSLFLAGVALAELPVRFDLRNVDGVSYVTSVKAATCNT